MIALDPLDHIERGRRRLGGETASRKEMKGKGRQMKTNRESLGSEWQSEPLNSSAHITAQAIDTPPCTGSMCVCACVCVGRSVRDCTC